MKTIFRLNQFFTVIFCLALVWMPLSAFFYVGIFSYAPCVFGIILLCGMGIVLNTSRESRFAWTDIFFAAFILYGIARLLLSSPSYADRFALWEWAAVIMGYVFVRSVKDENKETIQYALVIAGLIQTFIVFGQISGFLKSQHPYFTVTGSFGNPGQLGGYLAVCLILSAGLLKKWKRNFKILLPGLLFFTIMAAALIIADSRAALLAASTGMVVVFAKPIRNLWRRHKRIGFFASLTIAIIGCILIYYHRPESANARLLIWNVSADMIADKPLFGHGIGSFSKKYMLCQADYFENNPDSRFVMVADNAAYPYNEFLHIGTETGLVGLLLFIAILYSVFFSYSRNEINRLYNAGFIGLVVFSLFSYPSHVFPLLFLFPLLAGGAINKSIRIKLPRSFNPLLIVGVICICLFAIKEWTFYTRTTDEMKKFTSNGDTGSYLYIDEHFKKLINNSRFNAIYAEYIFRHDLYLTNNRICYLSPSCDTYCDIGNIYMYEQQFERAKYYLEKASFMIPSRLKPKYLLWRLYVNQGMIPQAENIAEELLSQSLKVENTYTIRTKAEVREWLYR